MRIRPACAQDLPRLTGLCHAGITRFGLPAQLRASQLEADLAARPCIANAMDDDTGLITGFAYVVRLNSATWQAAARTRKSFFAALPELELARIQATPATSCAAFLVTGATHLPGYDHVGALLRQWLFAREHNGHPPMTGLIAYHLLTADCPGLPEIIAAGLEKRTANIDLGDCRADEWLIRYGNGGFTGWIAKGMGIAAFHARPVGFQNGA